MRAFDVESSKKFASDLGWRHTSNCHKSLKMLDVFRTVMAEKKAG